MLLNQQKNHKQGDFNEIEQPPPSPLPLGRKPKYKLRDTTSSEWTKNEWGTWCFNIEELGKKDNFFLKHPFSDQICALSQNF